MTWSRAVTATILLLLGGCTGNGLPGCEQLQELAVKFAPILYFDRAEENLPSDVASFQAHTRLVHGTVPRLESREPLLRAEARLDWFFGRDPSREDVPTYCVVVPRSDTVLDLVFNLFYPFDFGKVLPLLGVECGNHVGDWEAVTVRIEASGGNNSQYRVVQVGGSIHGKGHTWKPQDLEWEGGRPKLYVLRGGHGTTNRAGVSPNVNPWLRAIGLRELHRGDGARWDTGTSLAIKFLGGAGQGGCPDVGDFTWWEYRGVWGNSEQGCGFFDGCFGAYCRLMSGPFGPITKGRKCGLFEPFKDAWCPDYTSVE